MPFLYNPIEVLVALISILSLGYQAGNFRRYFYGVFPQLKFMYTWWCLGIQVVGFCLAFYLYGVVFHWYVMLSIQVLWMVLCLYWMINGYFRQDWE